jgi:glutamate carboxypeptidase
MGALSSTERQAVERASAEPMLAQVQAWAAINSGTANLDGLQAVAGLLADEFAALPGQVELADAAPVEAVDPDGSKRQITYGRNLDLTLRPEAPEQLMFTGHKDTEFAKDHPVQALAWLEPDKLLGGPGVADMKGGIAVMLAALKAIEASPERGAIGYDVVINSDEEVGSPGSAALISRAAEGKRAALTYAPAALPDGTRAGARPGSGNFSFVVQ